MSAPFTDSPIEIDLPRELAAQLRVDSIRSSTSAGSGHPTSSMSAADLLAVLSLRHLRYDWDDPRSPDNDHLIFSKGHASPLLYALYKSVGVVSDDELMSDYRRFGSRLEGHPTPVLPWVDVATGSLGQGLPIAVGVALAAQCLEKRASHIWVLCGDSELAEGSIWEAIDKAAYYNLGNLTAIFDVNRLGQRGATEFGWDLDTYVARVEAFGARAIVVDGHDLQEIDRALTSARLEGADRPTVIVAKTIKGAGFSEVADKAEWHGKALPQDMADRAIAELGGIRHIVQRGPRPEVVEKAAAITATTEPLARPEYELGANVATRMAYGNALKWVGSNDPSVVVLDAEVSNSTFADAFAKEFPERFFEMFIAEQQLVASAVGMSVRGHVPFASTFAAFFTRAYDFIRMAAISRANIRLAGSHVGVEIGPDGPSQMALEDLSMMRAVHGSTVLYPSDATSATELVHTMSKTNGISYMRTTRGAYPVLYPPQEKFPIGGSKVIRESANDSITLIGAGVTLYECIKAAEALAVEGIEARVIDCYSIKPIDATGLSAAVSATGGRAVVVEDHHPEGGLGEAVLGALHLEKNDRLFVRHLAVTGMPGSGTGEELLAWAEIDAPAIAAAAHEVLAGSRPN